jgi:hypothetical protein
MGGRGEEQEGGSVKRQYESGSIRRPRGEEELLLIVVAGY